MKVHIEPYSPAWLAEFQSTKASLEEILDDIPYQYIEHVGSTSIPSLYAKPVIDIDIVVTFEQLPRVRQALSDAGYLDQGECGVPGRFQFRQPGFGAKENAWGSSADGTLRRNTYAMIENSLALKCHLDVKRVLVEDAELREEYGNVKKGLMDRDFEHINQYGGGKAPILKKILGKAGWSEEDVKKRNQQPLWDPEDKGITSARMT